MPPSSTAPLIVIDLQTDMFSGANLPPIHDADALVERVRALLAWARGSGRRVAFVRHDGPPGDPLAPGEPGWPVWTVLGQADDEPTFSKTEGDAFTNANLLAWVSGLGAAQVILTGAQTDCCVAATTHGALARGLKPLVVADAHSTWGSGSKMAEQIIAQHNEAFAEAGAEVIEAAEVMLS